MDNPTQNDEKNNPVQAELELAVVSMSGQNVDKIKLDPSWLEHKKGDQAIHDTVVAYRASKRRGTASAKNRSEVRGGGAKPWRQKGTGRARAGSNRSPIWRGGGIIFGPVPRTFTKKVNKKVRQLALRRAFTLRLKYDDIIVVDDLKIEEPKTKVAAAALKKVNAGLNTLIITENHDDRNLSLSLQNLPDVDLLGASAVNVYHLLLHKKILITKGAIESFAKNLN